MRLDHLLSGKQDVKLERSHLSVVEGMSPAIRGSLRVTSDRLGSVAQLVRAPS